MSVAGYLAYSFAAAFRTEPALTYIRDQLGADYLKIFDLDWQPEGAIATPLAAADWRSLEPSPASATGLADAGMPQFEGSNAWAVAGSRTRSGKPLLAGDPHISFAVPAVWYEAELSAPGFNLYGYFQALNPFALLGHNRDFGWSLTMFQNDDVDLIAEKTNPDNPNQVWSMASGRPGSTEQQIAVKGEHRCPHPAPLAPRPDRQRRAGQQRRQDADRHVVGVPRNREPDPRRLLPAQPRRHPGQDARSGSQGAGAGAEPRLGQRPWRHRLVGGGALPIRPDGVNPAFILDGSSGQADKLGFYPFSANPQQENPARLHRLGQLPATGGGADARLLQPGRPRPPARSPAERPDVKWDTQNSQALQLDTSTDYGPRTLAPLLGTCAAWPRATKRKAGRTTGRLARRLPAGLHQRHAVQPVPLRTGCALHDELGDTWFPTLISTRAIDAALPRLAADPDSPWWNTCAAAMSTPTAPPSCGWPGSAASSTCARPSARTRPAGMGQGPYPDPQPPAGVKSR
jgi:penicillin amidase